MPSSKWLSDRTERWGHERTKDARRKDCPAICRTPLPGWPFAKIAAELDLSKPTLINWSRKHQFQIQNLRAVELEALVDKALSSVSDRVNSLGEHLHKIEAELATRDIKELSTPQLFSIARRLRRQIEQTAGPLQFTSPVTQIPDDEYHAQVHDWKG